MADPQDFGPGIPLGAQAYEAMCEALRDKGEVRDLDLRALSWNAPRCWPSTLSKLDTQAGGFQGLSVLGGQWGVGKSMLGFASAMEAASSLDWVVVYFDAENDPDALARKADRYLARYPHAEDAIGNLHLVHVPRGVTCDDLASEAGQRAFEENRPILVVLDSVNTIAELMGRDYLRDLRRLSLWAMMARRISCGVVSFLAISELNKSGGIKGEALAYWADMFIRIKGEKDRGWVSIDWSKSRHTENGGALGKYVRHWEDFRFYEKGTFQLRLAANAPAPSGDDDDDVI